MSAASITVLKPPFTAETALAKVKAAENARNSRDPEVVARICASTAGETRR